MEDEILTFGTTRRLRFGAALANPPKTVENLGAICSSSSDSEYSGDEGATPRKRRPRKRRERLGPAARLMQQSKALALDPGEGDTSIDNRSVLLGRSGRVR